MIIQNSTKIKLQSDGTENNKLLKVTHDSGIITTVPKNELNTDYKTILQWVADGNTRVKQMINPIVIAEKTSAIVNRCLTFRKNRVGLPKI